MDATPLFLVLAAMAGFTGPAVAEALAWPDGRGVDPPVAVASAQAFTYAATPASTPTPTHYGAVWPFENWFAWGGLRAAGAERAAARVRDGVLDAGRRIGRMPECYAVEVRGSAPAILPRANRTQARTAGAVWTLEAGWDGRPGMLH